MVGRHGFHSFARGENTGFGPRSRQESQSQKQISPTAQVIQHASSLDGSVNFDSTGSWKGLTTQPLIT